MWCYTFKSLNKSCGVPMDKTIFENKQTNEQKLPGNSNHSKILSVVMFMEAMVRCSYGK